MLSLFTAKVLPPRPLPAARPFLVTLGALSVLLGVDDLFLFHEAAGRFGLDERALLSLLYLPFAVVLAGVFGRFTVRHTDWRILLLALLWLGVALVTDLVIPPLELPEALSGEPHTMLEEGTKLVGIAVWFAYVASTCAHLLRRRGGGRHRR